MRTGDDNGGNKLGVDRVCAARVRYWGKSLVVTFSTGYTMLAKGKVRKYEITACWENHDSTQRVELRKRGEKAFTVYAVWGKDGEVRESESNRKLPADAFSTYICVIAEFESLTKMELEKRKDV